MALDHLLGKPSSNWKRLETLLIGFFVLRYIDLNRNTVPKIFQSINSWMSKFLPWQIVVLTLMTRYISGRMFLMMFLNAPEVYAKHYNRNFYRATWILTSLDAGFWTAMPIRPKILRDFMSILFSLWYLINPDIADEKVRKLRSDATVEMMRISWEKGLNPYIWALGYLARKRLKYVTELKVERNQPTDNDLRRFPTWRPYTRVKIYYDGTKEELSKVDRLVVNFPGGGFITMKPENHEEALTHWAKILGKRVAIVSLDYGKAPEFPYPYGLEECFEFYKKVCETNGACIGINLNSKRRLRTALVGDSAGGNFVIGVTTKIIEELQAQREPKVPLNLRVTTSEMNLSKGSLFKPDGILVIYGALNFDMASWITPDTSHAKFVRPESHTSLTSLMKSYKGKKYHEERLSNQALSSPAYNKPKLSGMSSQYLSLTSRVAYFNDRIISPEMSRAMALLYLGSHSTHDPSTDYYLSPVLTPDEVLMEFPRVWLMCGEVDPFIDDTVIFAGRVREAIRQKMEAGDDDTDASGDNRSSIGNSSPPFKPTLGQNLPAEMTDLEAILTEKVPEKQSILGTIYKQTFGTLFRSGNKSPVLSSPEEADDEYEFDDPYGDVDKDPFNYVTVKIYAGLSHAYLQMLLMLPESKHAIKLSGDWLCEIFEMKDRMQKRRRRKKRALVKLEMRDEDNIPDEISLPPGAEYRVGGKAQKLVLRAATRDAPSRNKYSIGDSDSDSEKELNHELHIPVYDEVNESYQPLKEAEDIKRKQVLSYKEKDSALTSNSKAEHVSVSSRESIQPKRKESDFGFYIEPRAASPIITKIVQKSSDTELTPKKESTRSLPVDIKQTRNDSPLPGSLSSSKKSESNKVSSPSKDNAEMFLSEFDLLAKRRNLVEGNAYAGVPNLLKKTEETK